MCQDHIRFEEPQGINLKSIWVFGLNFQMQEINLEENWKKKSCNISNSLEIFSMEGKERNSQKIRENSK